MSLGVFMGGIAFIGIWFFTTDSISILLNQIEWINYALTTYFLQFPRSCKKFWISIQMLLLFQGCASWSDVLLTSWRSLRFLLTQSFECKSWNGSWFATFSQSKLNIKCMRCLFIKNKHKVSWASHALRFPPRVKWNWKLIKDQSAWFNVHTKVNQWQH